MARNQTQPKGMTKAELEKLGASIAHDFIKAIVTAEATQKDIILKAAEAHAKNPEHVVAILTGYENGLKSEGVSDSIVRVRKAEFKAVFDAVAKTEASEFNLKTLRNVKGYHNLIAKARELRGNKTRASSEKPRKAAEKLTDKQYEKLEETVSKASVSQLMDFADTAINKVHKDAPAELAGYQSLLLIQMAAGQVLKNEKVEDFFKKTAEAVLKIVEPAISQAQEAMKKTAEMKEQSKNSSQVVTHEKEKVA